MLGFALSTAVLLAIPIVNLAFRPIVFIGAAHVLGQLEDGSGAAPDAGDAAAAPAVVVAEASRQCAVAAGTVVDGDAATEARVFAFRKSTRRLYIRSRAPSA